VTDVREEILNLDHEGFLRYFNNESPRSRTILAVGLIEELLRLGILSRLQPNSSASQLFGPKQSNGLKRLSEFAHALGLIGEKELKALSGLGSIRNRFAHRWNANFEAPDVQDIAREINLLRLSSSENVPEHQLAFSKADYCCIFLVEEYTNRFVQVAVRDRLPAQVIDFIEVDLDTGAKTVNRTNNVA
jgi:hypothetical protein